MQHKDRQAEIEHQVVQTGVLEKKVPSAPTSQVHHLYFKVDCVDHQFPEDCEVFFFLYDLVRGRQVTERHAITWEKRKEKSQFHEQKSHSAVFTVRGLAAQSMCRLAFTCHCLTGLRHKGHAGHWYVLGVPDSQERWVERASSYHSH